MLTAHAVTRAATSIAFIGRSRNLRKNRPQSMDETQVLSPNVCFSPDSYLVYGIRRDSLRRSACHAPRRRSIQYSLNSAAILDHPPEPVIGPRDKRGPGGG